ncbi:hypothetical protein SUGI_0545460 [Cryptomeria japonica]|nr:hypothetical protein SUGI_0545460 [Cryptomeria japonica]
MGLQRGKRAMIMMRMQQLLQIRSGGSCVAPLSLGGFSWLPASSAWQKGIFMTCPMTSISVIGNLFISFYRLVYGAMGRDKDGEFLGSDGIVATVARMEDNRLIGFGSVFAVYFLLLATFGARVLDHVGFFCFIGSPS